MRHGHQGLADRRVIALGVALGFAVASLWMPWLYSGTRSRHAFELLGTVDELGFGPEMLRDAWHWLLPLVPLLAAVGFLAAAMAKRMLSLAAIVILVVVVAGGVLASMAEGLNKGYGTVVAGVSCCVAAYLSIASALYGRQ